MEGPTFLVLPLTPSLPPSLPPSLREGKALAQAVTTLNPPGVVLQFEKVYATCVLISKKRYVGQAFEKEEEVEGGEEGGKRGGRFDAKGIEVVRRDGCPLVVKVQEKALRILFEVRPPSLPPSLPSIP